ncbi:MAG: Xaa-Pro aminopeptidase [Gammaproteobacteria bacterium]|nr:MAG: Xaa-Pro aminopeptidase [Gammaproteobacteria bacterium]
MDKKEFARRRRAVMEEMGEGSIAILPAAPVRTRNRDVEYPYRQDSDFYYVTGFEEPEAVAVLVPGRKRGEYILFCRERDPEMELWNGVRSGLEGACEDYGADDAFPIGDVDDIIPGLLENQSRVYYAMGYYPDFDQRMIGWVNRVRTRSKAGVSSSADIVALDNVLHEMRLMKSKAEVRAMTRAMEISCSAHVRAMGACRPGMGEYEVEAEINYEFMRGGSRRAAYPSIVAGGANACVLHYTENRDTLRDGDLLLIDAGAEYDYYAADITRTFPVNGRFSKSQRALYEVVLEAQAAAIEQVQPGNHWNEPHEAAVEVLAQGLVALGLIKGRASTIIKKGRYRKFYVHRTGHWLGMDVHDVGDYKIGGEWRVLEPGMVMTVEPGLYVAAGDTQVARKWWNIGIRIEDDILVTRNGNKVLTAAVPKSVADIEATVGQG